MTTATVSVEDIHVFLTPRGGIEEVVLHVDGDQGRVALPVPSPRTATPAAHREFRDVLQPWAMARPHIPTAGPPTRPRPRAADVVGEYQRALAAGDVEAALAAFEPDGYVRGPGGTATSTAAPTAPRALHGSSSPTGAASRSSLRRLGRRALVRTGVHVAAWGDGPPQAGIAVSSAAPRQARRGRSYDDADRPGRPAPHSTHPKGTT